MTKKKINKISSEKELLEAIKKSGGKSGIIIFDEGEKDEKKDKNKISIDISKEVQMGLDNLRREIVEIISKTNDLDLMKKVEKCSYDKLILLLNIGFSEKAFYDTLNGNIEMKAIDIAFTEKSKEILNKLLEKEKEVQKNGN